MDFYNFFENTLIHFGTFKIDNESSLNCETQFLLWEQATPNKWFDLCRLWFHIHGSYPDRRLIINFHSYLIQNPELEVVFDEHTSLKIVCEDGFIMSRVFQYCLNKKKRQRFSSSDFSVKKPRLGLLRTILSTLTYMST